MGFYRVRCAALTLRTRLHPHSTTMAIITGTSIYRRHYASPAYFPMTTPTPAPAPAITPRPHQSSALKAIENGWRIFRKQLAVLPTGAGKTMIFSWLAAQQPGRTLILAHREELIDQAIDKLRLATGLHAQKEMADHHADRNARVVVASVQSMIRRLDNWPANHFQLVVADEAHHSISESWQRVLNHFSAARILGVTATPDRGDKKNLGRFYENIAAEVQLMDLIRDGYLAPITIKGVPLEIDLTRVRTVAGDYCDMDLGGTLDPLLTKIAQAIKIHAAGRKTLVFLPLIATSQKFAQACLAEGLRAEHVDGMSPDRAEILARFAGNTSELLTNAMLLTEGYDCPDISCVCCLRPTKSRALFSQMVGRGTRTAPGKQNLLLLDFLWLHEQHTLIRPAHLVAETEELAEAMTKMVMDKAAGGETQEELAIDDLLSDAQAQREEKLRAELAAKARREARLVDAMDYCLSLHSLSTAEWEDVVPWHREPPSDKQVQMLENNGIDATTVRSKGHASAIIDLIISRSRLHLATPKQVALAKRLGHQRAEQLTKDAASKYLAARCRTKRSTPRVNEQQ